MYGKPANIDKVWEDRDEAHELVQRQIEYEYLKFLRIPDLTFVSGSTIEREVYRLNNAAPTVRDFKRRRIVALVVMLLIVWYLMFRMVS
tara:strand:+ start:2826 stop:3092 length:267 start_codon:yes stop_codon:yes gene_type:complete